MGIGRALQTIRESLEPLFSGCPCHQKVPTTDYDDKEKLPEVLIPSLKEKLFMTATVVTIEKKYAVTPYIAEFWCTVTSFFFAWPLMIVYDVTFSDLQAIHQTFIILSIITATMSTLYHWSLLKLFSSADAAFATIMVALGTTALCIKNPSLYPEQDWPALWQGIVFTTALVFVVFWENTATTSLILFALFIPVNLYCLIQLGYWSTFFCGLIGISCFLIDRKGLAPTHSLWHFFGGLHLYYLIVSLIH